MAFELYGMLAGNVSPMTGEHVKPAYGGEEEAFLKKVVTPIYEVIAKVYGLFFFSLWNTDKLAVMKMFLVFFDISWQLCCIVGSR